MPFTFVTGSTVQEVNLSFAGEHGRLAGLELSSDTVKVVDGRAAAKLIIQFDAKPSLKAGSHYLIVEARDTATGRIIGTGRIPIIYNMHEVIGKCSC